MMTVLIVIFVMIVYAKMSKPSPSLSYLADVGSSVLQVGGNAWTMRALDGVQLFISSSSVKLCHPSTHTAMVSPGGQLQSPYLQRGICPLFSPVAKVS